MSNNLYSALHNKNIKYMISLTPQGNFGVYAKNYDYEKKTNYWHKLKIFDNIKDAEDYFESIKDLPKFK